MNFIKDKLQKRDYAMPLIDKILLDNEISLEMESDPPIFESRNSSKAPNFYSNDPFKQNTNI